MEKKKILIANRGEIAIRVIRAVQELGHTAVAVYETPDSAALHIRIANEAVWIGDGPRSDYLNIDKVIRAAKTHDVDLIHPRYDLPVAGRIRCPAGRICLPGLYHSQGL